MWRPTLISLGSFKWIVYIYVCGGFLTGIGCGLLFYSYLPQTTPPTYTTFQIPTTVPVLSQVPTAVNVSVSSPRALNTSRAHWRSINCSSPRVLFVVMSTPNNNGAGMRALARKAFQRNHGSDISVKFVLGTRKLEREHIEKLKKEHDTFKDLLLLDNHTDTYYQLSRKVKMSLEWAARNATFDYLVKTDDDVIVAVDKMMAALKEMGCPKNLYWGFCFKGKRVEKNGKWKQDDEWFECETYLPYCAGFGYVMERQLVESVMRYSEHLKVFRLEDSNVGLWLAPYRLTIKHEEERFAYSPTCNKNAILAHQIGSQKKFKTALNSLSARGWPCSHMN